MLPPQLEPLLRRPALWKNFYWLDEHVQPEIEALDCQVRFEVTPRHTLTLDICGSESFSLGLSLGGADPIELGWDDQAHWHPHVLRWQELDAVCRAVEARRDQAAAGVALLLLMRFAPITDEADGRLAWHPMSQAFDRVGLFSERERRAFFERLDVRGAGFRWKQTPLGLVLEQDDTLRSQAGALYTLRNPENEQFPFEELSRMFSHLDTSTRAPGPQVSLPPHTTALAMDLAHSNGFPSEAARFTEHFIDRALRHLEQGSASVSGAIHTGDGIHRSSMLDVLVRGDSAAQRLGGLLRSCGALGAATLRGGDLRVVEEPGIYVQLCNLSIYRWAPDKLRFDRRRLSAAQRPLVRAALAGLACELQDGPTSLSLSDGTQVRVAFPDLMTDETLDTGSIWLDRVSPQGAAFIHRVMRAASLFLVPGVIAPTAALGRSIDTRWPGTQVAETSEQLLALLQERIRGSAQST